jgi:cyanophycin synthetase
MVLDKVLDSPRINARRTDAFDIFNCKHYEGPNPYLNSSAFVFDFAFTSYVEPLPLDAYLHVVGKRYPQLLQQTYDSYAHLFARTVVEVGQLEMDLHLNRWSVKRQAAYDRIAVQSLHGRTNRAVTYCVWDWFEDITHDRQFNLDDQIEVLQSLFRQSVYGGPTVYALLRTAAEQGIPAFYLWDEGLMQYGYGKKQIRGVATTFDCDSHLDSDFTTRKDDCKAFLNTLGFPVPQGSVVDTLRDALDVADDIGYPVAVKPVTGHKGEGVTADVRNEDELEKAYDRALRAIPEEESVRIIVENSISGSDFRLLCVNGRFVAATERRPASVVGDGNSTIDELIDRENRTPARSDTPTSPLGKIKRDEAMERYLEEQGLSLDMVLESGHKVDLRKVANLSAGGFSIDATHTLHPDNIILAQDIAQHFRLTCLGIDVISTGLSESWKTGSLSIIEINAAPGIFMHLKPAIGEKVDVTSHILQTFYASAADARIPIISFNKVSAEDLQAITDEILVRHPTWVVGAVCRDGVFINRAEKKFRKIYNSNVQNLLRNPKLDLLIAEYPEDTLEAEGMLYYGSDVVVLDNPTEVEMILARDTFDHSTVVIKREDTIHIERSGLIEQYQLGSDERFSRVYLKEIATIL